MFIPHLILPNSVIATSIDGLPISIDNNHPNYATVVNLLTTSTVSSYDDLIDLMQPVREYRKALASSSFYENDMGDICIDISGYPFVLPSTLQNEVLRVNRANGNLNPLQAFVTRLSSNPDKDVHNQLYSFINTCGLTLTEDGYFLAYKKVRDDYLDIYTGTMDNSPGQTLEMPRFAVEKNPDRTCSAGLHFAAWGYLQHYGASGGDDRIVILKIDPSDVISIPSDYNNMKGRACMYQVLKEIAVPEELKYTSVWGNDEDDEYEDDEYEDDEYEDDEYGYDDYYDDEELSHEDQLPTARAEAIARAEAKEALLQIMSDEKAEKLLSLVESVASDTAKSVPRMSGGHFDYAQYTIDQAADNLEQVINNPGEYDPYSSDTITEFRTGLLLLRQAAIYLHRIDYLISCDDCESLFHSRLKEALDAVYVGNN